MMRCLLLLACVPLLLPAQDAREIVRRAIELDKHNTEVARNYTYLQREEERRLDGSGNVKSRKVRTFDVMQVDGSPYRRLVSRDDQPLPAAEQKEEMDKLLRSGAERQNETPEQRQKRIAEARKREAKRREPLQEMLDAFDFRLVGSDRVGGFEAWMIDATPRPGFKPRTTSGSILSKLKVRMWVEKEHGQWAKIEAETLGTIAFGGLVIRLSKGSRFSGEQIRINDEVWLPRKWNIEAAARILLVKGMRIEYLYTFSDYKKFSAESRVVSVANQ
jgi:hypothetical protein